MFKAPRAHRSHYCYHSKAAAPKGNVIQAALVLLSHVSAACPYFCSRSDKVNTFFRLMSEISSSLKLARNKNKMSATQNLAENRSERCEPRIVQGLESSTSRSELGGGALRKGDSSATGGQATATRAIRDASKRGSTGGGGQGGHG